MVLACKASAKAGAVFWLPLPSIIRYGSGGTSPRAGASTFCGIQRFVLPFQSDGLHGMSSFAQLTGYTFALPEGQEGKKRKWQIGKVTELLGNE
ncbi:MAG: hypothetical protein ACYDCO_07355 [Armatimonadota bacterium]